MKKRFFTIALAFAAIPAITLTAGNDQPEKVTVKTENVTVTTKTADNKVKISVNEKVKEPQIGRTKSPVTHKVNVVTKPENVECKAKIKTEDGTVKIMSKDDKLKVSTKSNVEKNTKKEPCLRGRNVTKADGKNAQKPRKHHSPDHMVGVTKKP